MPYADRRALIAGVEQVRGSKVIAYVLSDRETFPAGIPFGAQLTVEPIPLVADHLRALGHTPALDLFLYTRGGATDSVWPLVSLLREYCDRLTVIVPFRAHSGGTLICLGADEVLMTELAELSPIDPTTGNQFNPPDPLNPANRFGISVEDVTSYFKLAEDLAGASEPTTKLEVLKDLNRNVHPLALGNVQRVYLQIRRLADRLLCLHLQNDDARIEAIIKALTEEFYSHVHAITRREAIPLLGDWVRAPNETEAEPIRALFDAYSSDLELKTKFNLPEYMGDELIRDLSGATAFVESTEMSHVHQVDLKVTQRPVLPQNVQVQVPPGSPIPLVPWVNRTYEWGIQRVGWKLNEEEV